MLDQRRAERLRERTCHARPVALDDHVEIRRDERPTVERITHHATGEIRAGVPSRRRPRHGPERSEDPGRNATRQTIRQGHRGSQTGRRRDATHEAAAVTDDDERRPVRQMPAHGDLSRARIDDRHLAREHLRPGTAHVQARGAREVVTQDHGVARDERLDIATARSVERLPDRHRRRNRRDRGVDETEGPDLHLRIGMRALGHHARGWNVRYIRLSASDGKWV